MKKLTLLAFGLFSYLLFLFCTLYTMGFLNNRWVSTGVDQGESTTFGVALLINVGLVSLFGFCHSLFARKSIKQRLQWLLPEASIRSLYVFQSSAILIGVCIAWQAMPTSLWHFDNPMLAGLIYGLQGLGWALVVWATFAINHFELTGLQQVYHHLMDQDEPEPRFVTPLLYRIVRHPMQSGILLAFWCTPHMTLGHMVFALTMTIYILVGIRFEERSLLESFGDDYRRYQQQVPMLIPSLRHLKLVRTGALSGAK